LPPLTITIDELNEGLAIIDKSIDEVLNEAEVEVLQE